MKRLLLGGKIDLKPAGIWTEILALFLLSSLISAQADINRLCSIEEYVSSPGYKRILVSDFNGDSRSDILLYADEGKNSTVHFGEKEFKFSKPYEKFFFYPVNEIKKFNQVYGNQTYIMISRTERLASLVSFTDFGTVQILNNHQFDSYPSSLAVGDIDGDGKKEAVVSGSNFDGLSLLREENLILREEKILGNKIFKSVKLADFDYDGYLDICALDILNNSIMILMNNQLGDFSSGRYINNISSSLKDFIVGDLKGDGFIDLISFSDNILTLFHGDSVSSFESLEEIPFGWEIKQVKLNDLNNDAIPDLILLSDSRLVIGYASKEDSTFKSFVNYGLNKNIADLEITGTKNKRIILLSPGGTVQQIKRLENIGGNFTVPVAGKCFPVKVKKGSREFTNLYFLSPNRRNVIIMSDFNDYYSLALNSSYQEFIKPAGGPGGYHFLYNLGETKIQIIELNDRYEPLNRKSIFTEQGIIDIIPGENNKGLSVLSGARGIIGIHKYVPGDTSFSRNYFEIPDSNVLAAGFFDGSTVDYWKLSEAGIVHVNFDTESNRFSSMVIDELAGETGSRTKFYPVCLNAKGRKFLYIVISGDEERIYYHGGKAGVISVDNRTGIKFADLDSADRFSAVTIAGKQMLFYNDNKTKSLLKLEVDLPEGELKGTKFIESFDVNYYLTTSIEGKFFIISPDNSNTHTHFAEIK